MTHQPNFGIRVLTANDRETIVAFCDGSEILQAEVFPMESEQAIAVSIARFQLAIDLRDEPPPPPAPDIDF